MGQLLPSRPHPHPQGGAPSWGSKSQEPLVHQRSEGSFPARTRRRSCCYCILFLPKAVRSSDTRPAAPVENPPTAIDLSFPEAALRVPARPRLLNPSSLWTGHLFPPHFFLSSIFLCLHFLSLLVLFLFKI